MSLSDKRKATAPSTSTAAESSSKRVRIGDTSRRQRKREETDFFDGDPEIEEEERRRIRKDQKTGRIDDRGEDLSESSDDEGGDSDADADGGSHRRRAEKKRKGDATGAAGDDEDEDMFDLGSDNEDEKALKTKDKQNIALGVDEEAEDFGSTSRSALDAADNDAELLRGNNDDDDLDPDLQLEDESGDDEDEYIDQAVDLNAYAERSPPVSPGGTPIASARKAKSKKGKLKAPKVTGFNMKDEMRTGKFDEEGNYHENQRDPNAQHDAWLTGVYSKTKILEARKAQQKREEEAKEREKEAERLDGDEDEVKRRLAEYMMRNESVQRTLQRLGSALKEKKKEQKAQAKLEGSTSGLEDQVKQAAADVETVTHLSSVLMSRFGRLDIYDQTYEALLKDVHKSGLVRQTFDPASRFDPPPPAPVENTATTDAAVEGKDDDIEWEYRWTPAYLGAAAREAGTPVDPEIETFGPFSLPDLRSWADQGYFGDSGERILLRPKGSKDPWMTYERVLASQ